MRDDTLSFWLEIPEETTTVEFKRLVGDKIVSKILETIVAMANTDGGCIVVGIDDPEKTTLAGEARVYGIEENLEKFDEIKRGFARIMPGIAIDWPPQYIATDDGAKHVAIIEVPKSSQYLYQFNGRAYVRLNKGNKELTAHESIQYAYVRGFEHADSETAEVDLTLLNTTAYQSWAEARELNNRPIEEVLFATGLARHDKMKNMLPTRAAVMLFAEFPSSLMRTKCAIRILVYSGTIERYEAVPNLLQTPITIDGPTIQVIAQAQSTVLTLLRTGVRVPSGFVTTYAIPERAVKEAITNAVIHRDYHTKRDIEIRIFEDRLEIDSPGLFPYNITRRNIGRVRAEGYRNDLLVKHLREFPQPPNLDQNEGIPAMRSAMRAQNLYPPLFFVTKDSIQVVLWNEVESTEWEKLQDYLLKHQYVRNEVARKVTGIIQSQDMTRRFGQWVRQGLLVRIPSDPNVRRNVRYKLSDTAHLSTDDEKDSPDRASATEANK
jgi:ATP-dependent DNA helicase RecG